ncbi:MAG: hypothetical protein J1F16_03815 [Muribaculaceae bacterium]|nr:hypothetical protein [Muribaculaceae bacterium]
MKHLYGNMNGAPSSHHHPWRTVLKVCWTLGILIVIAGILFWIFASYLRPDHIAHLIEDKCSEYLDADVKIGHLDYKLFSTYPWLEFEVDSLTVISKSLRDVTPAQKDSLPADADLLAFILKLKGRINIKDLRKEKINMRDILIDHPFINLVEVDDKINNFNIAKKLPKIKKTPEIHLSEMRVGAPLIFKFFSLKEDTQAGLDVNSFYLAQEGNLYRVGFDGLVTGHYGLFSLPEAVPLSFTTGIRVDLPVVKMQLDDLSLALGGVTLDAKGKVKSNGKKIDVDKAYFNLKVDDLFSLLEYIPPVWRDNIKVPDGISGYLPINLALSIPGSFSIPLHSKEEFNLYQLPEMDLSLGISEGSLTYIPPKGKKVVADNILLDAEYYFNPIDSAENNLVVKQIAMNGEGLYLDASARVENVMSESQEIEADIRFDSSLMESLSYLLPKSVYKIAGHLKGDVKVKGDARQFGKEGFKDISLTANLSSKNLKANTGTKQSVRLNNLKTTITGKIPEYPLNDYYGSKFQVTLRADSVAGNVAGANLLVDNLRLRLDATDTVHGSLNPYGSLILKMEALRAEMENNKFRVRDIDADLKGTLNSAPVSNFTPVSLPSDANDSILQAKVPHSPLTLVYSGNGMFSTILNMASVDAKLNTGEGEFESSAYLYPIDFSGLHLSTDLNNYKFSGKDVKIADSGFSFDGEAEGIADFISSYEATPLKTSVDINFSNVDINQLSWGYYGAQLKLGNDSVWAIPPMKPYTAADSLCIVIPRNLDANIRLFSDAAEYMQYHFAPLSTDIIVKNGVATLHNLTVGTPYCTAVVDWTYSTSRLDNIFMDLSAKVKNFDFLEFYKVFPSLVNKAQELQNLSGKLNADISCYFDMFPDMFMNPESLRGRFDITSNALQFARHGKIARISHLMLIEGDAPIKIDNLNITGAYHDNILQVNPFQIHFDNYKIGIAGINNTQGKMYYHIALEESPFHLPVGVSLLGNFSHPEIRVGGTRLDDYRSEMVTTSVDTKIDVNIMSWLHHGWLLFVQEAAKYEGGLK